MNTKEWIRAGKFLLFSTGAGIIQVISFTILNEWVKTGYWFSYLVALTLSVLFNFTVNRKFTFKAANNVPIAMMKVGLFYLIFTPVSTWAGNYFEGKAHILANMEQLTDSIQVALAGKCSKENGGKAVAVDSKALETVSFDGYAFEKGYAAAAKPMYL